MVRESGISATRPVFPSFLLPSFKLPFTRRQSSASSSISSSSSGVTDSEGSSAQTTPNNSPPKTQPFNGSSRRLSRVAQDTIRCMACSTDVAFASQIISKGFTGRHGRAFLVSPGAASADPSLINVRVGRSENRQLVTGWHVVADISCNTCSTKLGWKYVDAKEESQKYKIGKFILETERVMTYCSWEDDITLHDEPLESKELARRGSGQSMDDIKESQDSDVSFDSEDEEECDDVFAGTWDAGAVARRRSLVVTQGKAK